VHGKPLVRGGYTANRSDSSNALPWLCNSSGPMFSRGRGGLPAIRDTPAVPVTSHNPPISLRSESFPNGVRAPGSERSLGPFGKTGLPARSRAVIFISLSVDGERGNERWDRRFRPGPHFACVRGQGGTSCGEPLRVTASDLSDPMRSVQHLHFSNGFLGQELFPLLSILPEHAFSKLLLPTLTLLPPSVFPTSLPRYTAVYSVTGIPFPLLRNPTYFSPMQSRPTCRRLYSSLHTCPELIVHLATTRLSTPHCLTRHIRPSYETSQPSVCPPLLSFLPILDLAGPLSYRLWALSFIPLSALLYRLSPSPSLVSRCPASHRTRVGADGFGSRIHHARTH
jgi:hypothetical protein